MRQLVGRQRRISLVGLSTGNRVLSFARLGRSIVRTMQDPCARWRKPYQKVASVPRGLRSQATATAEEAKTVRIYRRFERALRALGAEPGRLCPI